MIRHGETLSSDRAPLERLDGGPELSPRGHRQAAAVANRLAIEQEAIAAIYTTPLTRAVQTAEHIAAALDLPISCELPAPDYGHAAHSGAQHAHLRRSCGGGPGAGPVRRMGEHIDRLAERHHGQVVVLVCHKFSIIAAEQHFQRGPCEHVTIAVDHASITEWEHCPAGQLPDPSGLWRRRRHNDNAHQMFDMNRPDDSA